MGQIPVTDNIPCSTEPVTDFWKELKVDDITLRKFGDLVRTVILTEPDAMKRSATWKNVADFADGVSMVWSSAAKAARNDALKELESTGPR